MAIFLAATPRGRKAELASVAVGEGYRVETGADIGPVGAAIGARKRALGSPAVDVPRSMPSVRRLRPHAVVAAYAARPPCVAELCSQRRAGVTYRPACVAVALGRVREVAYAVACARARLLAGRRKVGLVGRRGAVSSGVALGRSDAGGSVVVRPLPQTAVCACVLRSARKVCRTYEV